MSIIINIPRQSRFITTSNIFTATFNNPALGKYDFGVAGNAGVIITEIFPNTIYLIDRMSISGNVSSQIYSNSIDVRPQVVLRKVSDKQIIYKKPYPMGKFSDNTEVTAFVKTDKNNDSIMATVTGILDQIPETVGMLEIKLIIDYHIYAVESRDFYKWFTGTLQWEPNK